VPSPLHLLVSVGFSFVDGQANCEGCCSKKHFVLVITKSAVSVELFLAAGGNVGILTEAQQDRNYKFSYYYGSRKGGFTNLGYSNLMCIGLCIILIIEE